MHEWYKTFILLAEYRSFTATAKHLFCSQPTVSQHIQQLENDLGCQLIIRNKRQIELTRKGKLVLDYAVKIQKLNQELRSDIQQEIEINHVTVYLSHYIAGSFFEELFDKNNSFIKNCTYEINSFCYEELKSFLIENRAKFAIMPIYEADKTIREMFDVDILFEEELVLVMAKDHPLASRQTVYARDLKNLPVLLPQSLYLKQDIKQTIQDKGVTVSYMQMTNFEIIKKAIQQGLGVSFLPYKSIEHDLDKMTYKHIKGLSIKRKNGIVFNREHTLNEREQAFCEHIKKNLKVSTS